MCAFESCQSVKKVSRSWAISIYYVYLHDKTNTVKKNLFKISWIYSTIITETKVTNC